MTVTRPKVRDHLERMRTGTSFLRRHLPNMLHETDRVAIDAQIAVIDDEVDAVEKLLTDILCDATATLDRIM